MPTINETLITFTPYLCTEEKFLNQINNELASEGELFYCYDSGRAYVMVNDASINKPVARPLKACTCQTINISDTQEQTITMPQKVADLLCLVTLASDSQKSIAAAANISVSAIDTNLQIKATSIPSESIALNILTFFNYNIA